MTVLARTAGVAMVCLAFAACGGGGDSDEAAIRDSFQAFFQAFEKLDVIALEGLLAESCPDRRATASRAIGAFQAQLSGDVDFNITGVEIQNLTETSVEAMPVGRYRFDDREGPLGAEGGEFAELVKEEDGWKFADCNILFGV